MPIKVLIVDDEALARKRIRRLLENDASITIIGECANGFETVAALQNHKPDLLFLDIQMPELNGFEVLQQFSPDQLPIIIFVTAYDKYALKAFEVHAVDYLLKPFDDERFFLALNHAKEQITKFKNQAFSQKLVNLMADVLENNHLTSEITTVKKTDAHYLERLIIKSSGLIYFVKTADIINIKAAGKYLEVVVGDHTYTLRQTMSEIEKKLNPSCFLRIHRSTIINMDFIKEMQHWYKNEYIFIMQNGEQLKSSGSCYKNLDKIIKEFS